LAGLRLAKHTNLVLESLRVRLVVSSNGNLGVHLLSPHRLVIIDIHLVVIILHVSVLLIVLILAGIRT
jgi:hypothetical protein